MPSLTHEGIIELFRDRPELAVELARERLGLGVVDYSDLQIESAQLSDVAPAELRADLVVVLTAEPERTPVQAIVVEVQRAPDPGKRTSWPFYVTGLRARLGD